VNAPGRARVEWASRGVISVTFSGHVTGALVEDVVARVEAAVAESPPRGAIFDTTDVSGFDASVALPGHQLLKRLRSAGAKHAVAITPNPAVRMIGSSVSIGTGLRMEFFATRRAAEPAIDSLEDRK
jgi:hypothetical protein